MKGIHLRLLTPYKTVVDREVEYVVLRTKDGDRGIRPRHAPYAAVLDNGVLQIYHEKQREENFVVLGGYVTVLDDVVTVISEMAEHPEHIEEAIEELKRKRQENEAQEKLSDLDIQQVEMGLRRALVHMDVSSYSIIKGHDEKVD